MLLFSDLDGTLLDHDSYSFEAALPALHELRRLEIPVIFTTSKTRSETEQLRSELGNEDPFIIENGAAVIVPPNSDLNAKITGLSKQNAHVMSAPRDNILSKLSALKDKGFRFESYRDWTVDKLMKITGLDRSSAERSMQREYSEPVIWQDSDEQLRLFLRLIKTLGLKAVKGGRFLHIMAGGDKGDAVVWFVEQWQLVYGNRPLVIAAGDSDNDVGMLNEADYAIVVRSAAHGFPDVTTAGHVLQTGAKGPAGWANAVQVILRAHGYLESDSDRLTK